MIILQNKVHSSEFIFVVAGDNAFVTHAMKSRALPGVPPEALDVPPVLTLQENIMINSSLELIVFSAFPIHVYCVYLIAMGSVENVLMKISGGIFLREVILHPKKKCSKNILYKNYGFF